MNVAEPSADTTADTTAVTLAATPADDDAAARFLLQAGFGTASDAELAEVRRLGFARWIDAEIARPPGQTRVAWMVAEGFAVEANRNGFAGADAAIWRPLIQGDDVLRQRVVLALSEIFVVSMVGLPMPWRGLAVCDYVDLLERHAFGRFRDLLEAVTLHPAMGTYLSLRGSARPDGSGRQPDENFARELLQLFTIGLVELEPDGRVRTVAGEPVASYGADDVSALARALTGWGFDRAGTPQWSPALRPMVHRAARFAGGDKRVLGHTIGAAATGPQALAQVLDRLVAHPNVGPFMARQFIQRLVMSNPGADYVGRVAAVFDDDGHGVRGNLAAVWRAVLLDPQARRRPPPARADLADGKLREPLLRFVQWARWVELGRDATRWRLGDLSDPATRLGQSPLRSPSVFNFFRPGYTPPHTALAAAGRVAPEAQLLNETSVAGFVDFMHAALERGVGPLKPDFERWLRLADDAAALVGWLVRSAGGGVAAPGTEARIAAAVATLPGGTDVGRRRRVQAAMLLVLAAPDLQVQR